jgi:CRISPR-associated protein Csx17
MFMSNVLALPGCQTQPLASYLKALGVFRLVAEQKDPQARCYWQENGFYLVSSLDAPALEQFFLREYQPTPILAPWNGQTGFFPKDKGNTLTQVRNSTTVRFQSYREAIEIALTIVHEMGLQKQPSEKGKKRLLVKLRNQLPDPALPWLDTCSLIADEEIKFPPLTGSGGNDGNLEFSRTFMQRLLDLIKKDQGTPQPEADVLLQASLFGEILPGLSFKGSIGQFHPLAAGGVNAHPGFQADSRVNAWDFVLMMEGLILFRAGSTRRYEHTAPGELSYPFTVRASAVGYGSASEADKARAELWVPVWTTPVGLKGLQSLFSEGRAKVQKRTAQTGVDFARGLSNLARQRGIHAFVRYSFLERNGLSYFAIPLGQFAPQQQPQVDLLADIDSWLMSLRRTNSETSPASVRNAYRYLEESIFELACGKGHFLDVVMALGAMEAALSRSLKFTLEKGIKPFPTIWGKAYERAKQWLVALATDEPEFRLALALAGRPLMRQRLVKVREKRRGKTIRLEWAEENDPITTWQQGSLTTNLLHLLQREAIEQQQQSKAESSQSSEEQADMASQAQESSQASMRPKAYASLSDVAAWINGNVDEVRLEAILRGLCLLKIPDQPVPFEPHLPPDLPPAFRVLVNVHSGLVKWGEQKVEVKRVPNLLGQLTAGDCFSATTLALHRLRADGLPIGLDEGIYEPPERTRRMGAALAFPLTLGQREKLILPLLKANHDLSPANCSFANCSFL